MSNRIGYNKYDTYYENLENFNNVNAPSNISSETTTIKKEMNKIKDQLFELGGKTASMADDVITDTAKTNKTWDTYTEDALIPATKKIPELKKLLEQRKRFSEIVYTNNGEEVYFAGNYNFDNYLREYTGGNAIISIDNIDQQIDSKINEIKKLAKANFSRVIIDPYPQVLYGPAPIIDPIYQDLYGVMPITEPTRQPLYGVVTPIEPIYQDLYGVMPITTEPLIQPAYGVKPRYEYETAQPLYGVKVIDQKIGTDSDGRIVYSNNSKTQTKYMVFDNNGNEKIVDKVPTSGKYAEVKVDKNGNMNVSGEVKIGKPATNNTTTGSTQTKYMVFDNNGNEKIVDKAPTSGKYVEVKVDKNGNMNVSGEVKIGKPTTSGTTSGKTKTMYAVKGSNGDVQFVDKAPANGKYAEVKVKDNGMYISEIK